MAKSFLNIPGLPIGLRNNNPGNLRATGDNWKGMIGTNGGFVVFENIAWGIRALAIDLRGDINEGKNTVERLISEFAPPFENDTFAYIKKVSDYTGFTTDILKPDYDTLSKLIRAIMNVELGPGYSAMVPDSDIKEGLALMGGVDIIGPAGFTISTILLLFAIGLLVTMPKLR